MQQKMVPELREMRYEENERALKQLLVDKRRLKGDMITTSKFLIGHDEVNQKFRIKRNIN